MTGDFLHNDRGIENPTSSFNAIHDTTNQFHGLAYVSAIIDPDTRLSLILGGFDGAFKIPNNPGQPTLGFTVNGVSAVRQQQAERDISAKKRISRFCRCRSMCDDVDLQVSAFTRYSSLYFSPDWLGDLLFNGIAQQATRTDTAYGIQADGSWRINEQHTLRAGLLVQQEAIVANTTSQVLPVDASGTPTTDVPLSIIDNSTHSGGLYGVYVQDEWHILPAVTINGGLRFDAVDEFTHEHQVSPRLNVVWKPTPDNDGACRLRALFRAAAVRVGAADLDRQSPWHDRRARGDAERHGKGRAVATTSMSGVSQVVVPGLTVGVDAYYKISQAT